MLNPEDLKIEGVPDRPKSGMWHNGPNPCWITVTHLPTMISARAYDYSQHKARQSALACVEMMVEQSRAERCSFPERVSQPAPASGDSTASPCDQRLIETNGRQP